jgi:hypothetical protein
MQYIVAKFGDGECSVFRGSDEFTCDSCEYTLPCDSDRYQICIAGMVNIYCEHCVRDIAAIVNELAAASVDL